jgi:hypothetical protein
MNGLKRGAQGIGHFMSEIQGVSDIDADLQHKV